MLGYTFLLWSGFLQVACALEGVTRGAWFASIFIRDDVAPEQPLITVS